MQIEKKPLHPHRGSEEGLNNLQSIYCRNAAARIGDKRKNELDFEMKLFSLEYKASGNLGKINQLEQNVWSTLVRAIQ